MHDYYLNTETETVMVEALLAAGVAQQVEAIVDEAGEVLHPAHLQLAAGVDLSVIGPWFERAGGTDEEPVMAQLLGWHFNVRSAELITWPESVNVVNPVTPWRVWG